MIEVHKLLDEMNRFDRWHRERLCACCADDPEVQGSALRRAFERAAAERKSRFLACSNCLRCWTPNPNIDEAVRDWMLVVNERRLIAALCGNCAASTPEVTRLPKIARLLLERSSPGPIQ